MFVFQGFVVKNIQAISGLFRFRIKMYMIVAILLLSHSLYMSRNDMLWATVVQNRHQHTSSFCTLPEPYVAYMNLMVWTDVVRFICTLDG